MKQTLFVKYNRTRKPEYQIRTSIVEEDGVRYVEKAALCLEGQLHIHSFQKKYELLTGQNPHVQVLKPEFPQGDAFVRFPFLKGQSLAERMGSQIREGRPAAEVLKEGLSLIFGEGQEPFTSTPAFEEVFGTIPDIQDESFHVSNVDALFENVMETAEGLWFMDYEWVFEFPVPMGYLRYRNLYYFFERFKNAFGWSDVLGFLAQFDITKEQADIYRAMEEAFQTYAHGDSSQGYLSRYQQKVTTFEELKEEEQELFRARERILALQEEVEDKNLEIRKRNETQRLSNNHIANLDAIIRDLRREVDEMGKLLTYLNRHEAIIFKVWRKIKGAVSRRFPAGTRRRKILEYGLHTLRHPIRYCRLYVTREGRNRIAGDFAIGSSYFEHGRLVFPKDPVKAPTVSIVIPVYNQIHYTYACLLSILEHTKDVSYEVIIADDVSTDATKELGKYTENLVICRNSVNQGFLRNCNQAAMSARGKYIMFLNNDTQVTEGWLSSLVNLIESDPTIGMVGSKLVYPDGRLQEAGGIIWSDGSGWNYGRLDDPDKAEYNYVKDVDYISGAAILLSTRLWKQLGGFDVRFAPAYCEDSDLAFQVRKAGYRVVYQPLSKVIHFEGISNGTDVNGGGLKRYQVENSRKLKEKWAEEFKKQCVNTGNPNPFRARERSMGKPIILVVDHYVPTYDKDAGSKTTFQYLKMFLKKGYVVKFLGDNFLHEEPYSTTLQQMGIEILYGEEYQTKIWDWIKENGSEIAFAYLNRPHIAGKYVDFIRDNTNIKIIYYGHDLHFLREFREYELTGDLKKKRESDYWRSIELSMMYKAAVSYYPSQVEVDAIHRIDETIPVKAITAYVYENFLENLQKDFAKREGLLFVGGFAHPPNADGVLWFAREIFPLIRQKLPHVVFYVVGSKVTEEIKALDSQENGIIVKGFVSEEELSRLYAECRMVVVPLRYGAGVKGKVVEAIYNGAPIVTTSVGAEGIPGVEDVLRIADEPEDFARQTAELYEDTETLRRMCEKTQEYIRAHFSVDGAWKVIEEDFAWDGQQG